MSSPGGGPGRRRRPNGEVSATSDTGEAAQAPERSGSGKAGMTRRVRRAGRTGWALVGIAAVLVLAGFVLSELSLVVVPVVLALFPATLLVPVSDRLKRIGVPAALAALIALLGGLGLIALVLGLMVPLVAMELPELAASAGEGLSELQSLVSEHLGIDIGSMSEAMDEGAELLGEAGDVGGQALAAAIVAFETVTGALIMLVVLFFYLKDGRRLANAVLTTAPSDVRRHIREISDRAWATLSSYFRGQLFVALADAVFIGIGLVILGVPLALPLAVLIFFGGLFPVVGAVTTGVLAVLVAFADAGFGIALIVVGLVLVVQQVEANVLQPYVLGHAIDLHPLVVLLSITIGAIVAGILGAFLAVPLAAIIARSLDYVREHAAEASSGTSATPATGEAAG